MTTQQPVAMKLAEMLTADEWPGSVTLVSYAQECVAELRRQHARITALESQLAQRFDAADMATAAAQGFRDGVVYAELPDAPLPVFSKGPWTFKETGQSFSGAELDEAAFVAYRDRASHGQAPASVLHLVNSAFAEIAMAFPKAFALHKVGIADKAVHEALAAPAPPPECETEAEKRAFAFGWFKALESERMKTESVQEDAARYRWLREGNDAKHGAAWHVAVNLYGCEWDAAIDAARKQ